MSDIVNVHDLKTNYSKYLERAAHGEEIILSKYGKPVAKLTPLPNAGKPRRLGTFKGKIWVSDDFDEPMLDLWDVIDKKKLG